MQFNNFIIAYLISVIQDKFTQPGSESDNIEYFFIVEVFAVV